MSDVKKATVADLMAQIRCGLARLTLRRLRQGKTIEEMAAMIDMSPGNWWGVLSGENELTERTLAEMAFALDAEIEISLRPWEQEGLAEALPDRSAA